MCTTNNSTKKRGARACKPARRDHHAPPKRTRTKANDKAEGSELQNRGISAPQETSLPRGSTRTQRCVPKRLMSSFPALDKKRDAARVLDLAALGRYGVDLQSLRHGEGVVGLAQRPVDGDDAVAVRHVAELAARPDRLGSQQTHGRALLVGVLGALRGTTASRNCLCTFTRRVDSPTATSTASRRLRPRHVQVHFLLRATDRVQ